MFSLVKDVVGKRFYAVVFAGSHENRMVFAVALGLSIRPATVRAQALYVCGFSGQTIDKVGRVG